MPNRPRRTELQLLVAGTWKPGRHGRPKLSPEQPVGEPPACLGPAERKVWRETATSATWLRHPDRALLEVHCRLLVEQRSSFAEMSAARLALLIGVAARLGLAPTDRVRLTPPPEPKPNRF